MSPVSRPIAATDADDAPLLETTRLTKHFRVGRGLSRQLLHAVDDVDLTIGRQEIVALVGESGSGKSTIARLLARVYRPTSGEILYQGRPLSSMRVAPGPVGLPRRRADGVPGPVQLAQPRLPGLPRHPARPEAAPAATSTRAQRHAEAERVIEAVGLSPAGDILDRYPYELSGGQRQRIGFAQALALPAQADPGRRAGLDARRVDPHRPAQPDGRAAPSRGRVVPLHHARHRQRAVRRRPADGHVRRSHRGVRPDRGRCWPTRSTPTRSCCSSAVPDPRAPLTAAVDGDTGEPPKVIDPTPGCRFRWRCPLASTSATRSRRSSAASARTTTPPATSPNPTPVSLSADGTRWDTRLKSPRSCPPSF